ncbi:MAG TPA: nitroreductase family protein [Syntrophorhabdales bacterium]|jgi:5,6-dimethylbenzimidazole synthase|nr:nitroreductase family protein [Syntrophorhabdales bacterium]
MDYDGFLELVKARRSIRGFKPDPIPDDYVDKIIEAARFAPSGANSQPWEFIVIKDQATKDGIATLVREQGDYSRKVEMTRAEELRMGGPAAPVREPAYKNAPVFILVCGDPRTKDAYPLLTTLTRGDSHFASSLASAFLCMTLAATSLGLGSQWLSATGSPYVKPLLQELLDIPEKMDIYDMLVVGYPSYQPKSRFVRERADMVHHGRFDRSRYRTDEEIRQYIALLRKG